MSILKWLIGLVWQLVGKLPQGHDQWNSVDDHPDDQPHRR